MLFGHYVAHDYFTATGKDSGNVFALPPTGVRGSDEVWNAIPVTHCLHRLRIINDCGCSRSLRQRSYPSLPLPFLASIVEENARSWPHRSLQGRPNIQQVGSQSSCSASHITQSSAPRMDDGLERSNRRGGRLFQGLVCDLNLGRRH